MLEHHCDSDKHSTMLEHHCANICPIFGAFLIFTKCLVAPQAFQPILWLRRLSIWTSLVYNER